jgi:ferredoxin
MTAHQVILLTPEGEVSFEVSGEDYLLDAAARAGLELDFSCLQGWCLTCAGRVLAGHVNQTEARRCYPQDAAAGYVLLCSSHARSDLRILTDQKEEMRQHRRVLGLPTPNG